MNNLLDSIFGIEAIIAFLILAVALLVTGFRRQATAVFLLALTLAFLPAIRSFLLLFFPFWVTIVVSMVIVLVALYIMLSLLLGDAASHTIGQLTADLIKALLRLPFWLWEKLRIGALLKWFGLAVGRAGIEAVRQSSAHVKGRIAARKATDLTDEQKTHEGTVAAIEGNDYYVDLGEGVTGMLPIELCEEKLEVGQVVVCEIVEQVDEYMVDVRPAVS